MKYYQLKHGFHAVLEDWQLARLRPVFRLERLAISPTSFSTPPFLSINWETVAHHNLTQVNTVSMKFQFWMVNITLFHICREEPGVSGSPTLSSMTILKFIDTTSSSTLVRT